MKGGVALSLGRDACAHGGAGAFDEVALLLVNDEEFRTEPFAHGPRFADFDACLCFEGGERTAAGEEAVVVRRKAAAAIRVEATGIAAHAGANPDAGRNALLALASVATVARRASRSERAGGAQRGPDDDRRRRGHQRRARQRRALDRHARGRRGRASNR